MDIGEALASLGGVARRHQLIALTSRRAFERAVRSGAVVRLSNGRFAADSDQDGASLASQFGGYLCLADAAVHLGWEVKSLGVRPHVLFPHFARIDASAHSQLIVHRARLGPDDVIGQSTSPDRTLDMCGRGLPFDEALAIADSALRHGYSHKRLVALAATARGPGCVQLRRVAKHADARSANPFESCLRAACLDVLGLRVQPQRVIALVDKDVRPDLVDPELRLVIEADSFEFHGHRAALAADTIRYNALVSEGWTVLRFSYEQVMGHGDQVRDVVTSVVQQISNPSARPGLRQLSTELRPAKAPQSQRHTQAWFGPRFRRCTSTSVVCLLASR